MIRTDQLLQTFLRGIREQSETIAASLFVPPGLTAATHPLLLHEGSAPVHELANLETAQHFAKTARPPAAKDGKTVHLSGAEPGTYLLPLLRTPPAPATNRRRDSDALASKERQPIAWLGLRYAMPGPPATGPLDPQSAATTSWDWILQLGSELANYTARVSAVLVDPITGLPDRTELQGILNETMARARRLDRPLSLLFINPDDFAVINEQFGPKAGDKILRDLANSLRSILRTTDPLARYGGAIFAAVLPDTPPDDAATVARKMHRSLQQRSFLSGAVRLGFSVGTAAFDPTDDSLKSATDLFLRADQALNAVKRLGGGTVLDWTERASAPEETGKVGRLTGIFTGNMSKDYRNMVLLWETIDAMALHQESEALSAHVVRLLEQRFKPDRVGLFRGTRPSSLKLVHGVTQETDPESDETSGHFELSELEREIVAEALGEREPREGTLAPSTGTGERNVFSIPIVAREQVLGCLYMDGDPNSLTLDSSDLIVLKGLAGQVGMALDRAELAEQERHQGARERQSLRAELDELREALQHAKLVYQSPQIDQLLATARRVAPTDATVLITGESGTGKELVAHTIHELSPRRKNPLVVVDCGAIPTTLIESELFGAERGAYTGAQQRKMGRLAEANGGTVLLDEIGELPLEVQSKLLRFVQEKQLMAVGGTRPRKVDVRILAATNRDLAAEVKANNFREDLYYRLNVVRLEVPALRERPEDILHLGRHFLRLFAHQYQKPVERLSAEAEAAMLKHNWPGNVRELQNRMMQAVILCDEEELGADGLKIPVAKPEEVAGVEEAPTPTDSALDTAATAGFDAGASQPREVLWETLSGALARQVESVLSRPKPLPLPLGKWLSDDIVLEAAAAADGVARRAAEMVGIPETTFRRRLRYAEAQTEAGLSTRLPAWEEVLSVLSNLVRTENTDGEDMLERAMLTLLRQVVSRVDGNVRRGSSLLGVTAPTYRRRLAMLQEIDSAEAKAAPAEE